MSDWRPLPGDRYVKPDAQPSERPPWPWEDEAVIERAARAIIDVQNMRMREARDAGIMEPRHFTQIDLNEDEYTRDEYMEYARAAVRATFQAVPARGSQ